MQLAQSEPLSLQDDHHGSVGYVDTYLYHGGSHQNLRLATHELLHLCLLVGRLHLAVYFAESELWEHLCQHLKAVFQVLQVNLLAFLYQWEYDVHLAPLVDLLPYTVIE